ncbi:MAG: M56 family metallopeptidase [candidate division KSB1 bacterium]|nr:M56 family metallopeptidase [candidate division KSB1 bacterium]
MQALLNLAEAWWPVYAIHFVEISLFIALVWLIDRRMAPSTRLRYGLWTLALVKLYLPPVFSFHRISPAVETLDAPILQAVPVLTWPDDMLAVQLSRGVSLPLLLFGLWLLLAAVMLALIVFQNLRIRRTLKSATRMERLPTPDLLPECPPRRCELWLSPNLSSPLVFGLVRPRVYLPAGFLNWPAEQRRSVLAHELAHLHFRDTWFLLLQIMALVLFAANPLVWLVHRRLLQIRELRCDEWAISRTGIEPRTYGRILLSVLQEQVQPAAARMVGAYFAESRKTLLQRFSHLLHLEKRLPRSRAVHRVVFVGLGAVMVLFSWRCQGLKAPFPPTTSSPADLQPVWDYDVPPRPKNDLPGMLKQFRESFAQLKTRPKGNLLFDLTINERGKTVAAQLRQPEPMPDDLSDLVATAHRLLLAVEWEPARIGNRPVPARIQIPISFEVSGTRPKAPHRSGCVFA